LIRRLGWWNDKLGQWLWWIVILGVLASLPIAYQRIESEQTARQVEFVFDYRDLLDISDLKPNPTQFIDRQLGEMKEAGITSLAIYESTLNELRESRRIDLFSTHEALALTQLPLAPNENFTYLLFTSQQAQQKLQPLIEAGFARLHIATRPWSFKSQSGMIIEMGREDAGIKPLDPDPIAMQQLKDRGFHLVVRLSNRVQPFDVGHMDTLLGQLHELGVNRIIIDGPAVPGYTTDGKKDQLLQMAELLNKHQIGLAAIELLKIPQKGFATLAKAINYNVVRLHSFTEADGDKLGGNLTDEELDGLIRGVTDRFVLAVKDRNIRMVFLNARPSRNMDKGIYTDPLDAIYASLKGHDGAENRMIRENFTLGPAKQMIVYHGGWQPLAKAILFLACLALIALTVAMFIPQLLTISFLLGGVGSAALYVLSSSIYSQLTALAVAICAPTAAIVMAMRSASARNRREGASTGAAIGFAARLLLRTVLVSFIGIVFVIGLLNGITYSLVLQQFRGVSALHVVPIVLAGLYLLFYLGVPNWAERKAKIRQVLAMKISILWVIIAAVLTGIGMYYLSRTGNEGQASAVERMFRSFLEETLKVRPRTKEFLIAHPLFILGAYLCCRYRWPILLIFAGVIGQLSIVDTFAHLHTPVVISLIRSAYGVVFGIVIGLVLIACWEFVARSWHGWARKLNKS
jgi:hypothetical protein